MYQKLITMETPFAVVLGGSTTALNVKGGRVVVGRVVINKHDTAR